MLLDSLTEVQINGHVLNLALQLVEAFLEVEVLVGLGEDNLVERLLSLDLGGSHQSFHVLHRRLAVGVLLADHHLQLDQGQEVLLGTHWQHHRDARLVLDVHFLAHLAVLSGGCLVLRNLPPVRLALSELNIEPLRHLEKLILLGCQKGKHLGRAEGLPSQQPFVHHGCQVRHLDVCHQVRVVQASLQGDDQLFVRLLLIEPDHLMQVAS